MRLLLGWVVFVLGLSVEAKTVFVSDIDDTVKNSHVLDTQDKVINAVYVSRVFRGMNWLYRGLETAQPDFKFFYVSNAQHDLMVDLHTALLKFNKFPKGDLYLKKNIFESDFKFRKISEIITAEKPETAVLVGDNGELDSQIYARLQAAFPQVQFVTYIHQVYSVKNTEEKGAALLPGQIAFVTSADLLLQFYARGWVSEAYVNNFAKAFAVAYEREKKDDDRAAIPEWADCRDFTWSVKDSLFISSAEMSSIKGSILNRCALPPQND